jgi:hypothetical protein
VTSAARRPPDRRRTRHRRGRVAARWLLRVAVVAMAFVLGLAVGRALEDDPEPGGERTFVRTLRPLPLAPAPQTVTATVTVTTG